MEFINYYDLLKLPRNATAADIERAFNYFGEVETSAVRFKHLLEARNTLLNPYRRGRYDKTIGYLMTIQTNFNFVSHGACYQLSQKTQPLLTLQRLQAVFQEWVLRKFGYTWEEAEESNFAYRISLQNDNPHLIVSAPREEDLQRFANELITSRQIKPLS